MSVVPALYAPWLDAFLPGPLTSEPEATCDACPRCLSPRSDEAPFRLDTKCCGYQPKLVTGPATGDAQAKPKKKAKQKK